MSRRDEPKARVPARAVRILRFEGQREDPPRRSSPSPLASCPPARSSSSDAGCAGHPASNSWYASSTTSMPGVCLTNLYGPLIGCFVKPSSPTSVRYFRGTTIPAAVAEVPSSIRKSGQASPQSHAQREWIDHLHLLDALVECPRAGALVALEAELESSAVTGSPLWNLSPRRSLNSYTRPSALSPPRLGEAGADLLARGADAAARRGSRTGCRTPWCAAGPWTGRTSSGQRHMPRDHRLT